jgi:hypothetical protein
MTGLASGSQNATTSRRRSVHQRSCRTGSPGVDALDHPPAARLDRCRDAPRGDLADHAAFSQHLPAGW